MCPKIEETMSCSINFDKQLIIAFYDPVLPKISTRFTQTPCCRAHAPDPLWNLVIYLFQCSCDCSEYCKFTSISQLMRALCAPKTSIRLFPFRRRSSSLPRSYLTVDNKPFIVLNQIMIFNRTLYFFNNYFWMCFFCSHHE